MNLAGNTILVSVGEDELTCQLDSTFTTTSNFTANNPCKGEAKDETQTLSSKSWSITFNGKTQVGTTGDTDQNALLDAQKSGVPVTVIFAPKPSLNPTATSNWIITGSAYVSEVTVEAPVDGESTYSGTFTGTGAWTKTVVPVAP